ncbi:hypothetical protein CC2G_003457 [Coprinopsis cinerea AmutBmut pab1-1]|nr:hypothetical protein CC2G_003457 [Coprinopsis cinerea AmutBmut pab1-1]
MSSFNDPEISMDTLPSELLEHIVEEFTVDPKHDHQTLAKCSLVSRAFRAAAQPRLFRSISLKTQDENTQKLITALSDSPDRLALHVSRLEMTPSTFKSCTVCTVSGGRWVPGCLDNLPACRTWARVKLPNLVHLVLECGLGGGSCLSDRWGHFPVAIQNWILDICTGKTEARLQSLDIEYLRNLPPSILQTGPTLKQLLFTDAAFDPEKLRDLRGAAESNDSDHGWTNLCRPKRLGLSPLHGDSDVRRDLLSLDPKILSEVEKLLVET